jgi:hypothetical protein
MGFMRDGQRLVGNRFFDEKLVGNRTPNFFGTLIFRLESTIYLLRQIAFTTVSISNQ